MAKVVLLLPPRVELEPIGRGGALARLFAGAAAEPAAPAAAPWQGLFEVDPPDPGAAVLSALHDGFDVSGFTWLRADPATLAVDAGGLRLIGTAESVLSSAEREELEARLTPVCAERGAELVFTKHARAYLRLPADVELPRFATPEVARGEDLRAHLPEGADAARWRALLNEVQMVLHDLPFNRTRRSVGRPLINTLWLWGSGPAPERVQTAFDAVITTDPVLGGLAGCAGVTVATTTQAAAAARYTLIDLRAETDRARLEAAWIEPALHALETGALTTLRVASSDGARWRCRPRAGWRSWWRRPR